MRVSDSDWGRAVRVAGEFESAIRQYTGMVDTDTSTLFEAIQSLYGQCPNQLLRRAHAIRDIRNDLAHGRRNSRLTSETLRDFEEECCNLAKLITGSPLVIEKCRRQIRIPLPVYLFFILLCVASVLVWQAIAWLKTVTKQELNGAIGFIMVLVALAAFVGGLVKKG